MLKGGRSLERQVSLKSGARVQDALERLGHQVIAIDVGADLVARLGAEAPERRVRRAARPRRRGRHRPGAARGDGHPVHGLGRVGVHRAADKVLAKHADARRRDPHPRLLRVQRDRVPRARRGQALPAIEDRLEFPIVVKPAGQGSALGIKFAAHDRRRARRAGGRVLLRPQGAARAPRAGPRPGGVDHRAAGARRCCRSSRRSPSEEDFYDFEARYEIGRTAFVCPAELDDELAARAQAIALDVYAAARLLAASRAST